LVTACPSSPLKEQPLLQDSLAIASCIAKLPIISAQNLIATAPWLIKVVRIPIASDLYQDTASGS
jgi:hypothetical protein